MEQSRGIIRINGGRKRSRLTLKKKRSPSGTFYKDLIIHIYRAPRLMFWCMRNQFLVPSPSSVPCNDKCIYVLLALSPYFLFLFLPMFDVDFYVK